MTEEDDILHAHIPRRVTLCDVVTGEVVTATSTESLWWWTEGNGSCDCNRIDFFPGHEDEDDNHCAGCKRYVVACAEPPLDWVVDANHGYPPEALQLAAQVAAQEAKS